MELNPCRNCALAELQISGTLLSDGYYRCSAGCEKVSTNCDRFELDKLNKDLDI